MLASYSGSFQGGGAGREKIQHDCIISMWPHYIIDNCTVTHFNVCRLVQYFIPSVTALAPSSLIWLLERL